MIKKMTIHELIEYLDNNFVDKVLIKVFSNEKYAHDFADGKLCLGTIEYYRHKYENDGRGDRDDSVTVYPVALGVSDKDTPFKIENVFTTFTYLQTAFVFCMMEYDHCDESRNKLIEYLTSDENLGFYFCIIKDRKEFDKQIRKIKFVKVLEGEKMVPILDLNRFLSGTIKYVEKPNSFELQKRNVRKYIIQQEYRYSFNFKVTGLRQDEKGQMRSTCLFETPNSIECDIFEIVP